jgi:hypothetical protein
MFRSYDHLQAEIHLLEITLLTTAALSGDPEARVRFPALADFLSSSGSGTGYTQPREYTRGVNGVIRVVEK